MGKNGIIAFVVASLCFSAMADIQPRSFGLDFQPGIRLAGLGVSINRGWGDVNRWEIDFGVISRSFDSAIERGISESDWWIIRMNLLYQWYIPIYGEFNWFGGPIAGLGICWDEKPKYNTDKYYNTVGLYLGVGGRTGIEYDLGVVDVPIVISVDVRPILNLLKVSSIDTFSFIFNVSFKGYRKEE